MRNISVFMARKAALADERFYNPSNSFYPAFAEKSIDNL